MNRFARRVPQKRVVGNADLGERYDVGLLTNGFFHEATDRLQVVPFVSTTYFKLCRSDPNCIHSYRPLWFTQHRSLDLLTTYFILEWEGF